MDSHSLREHLLKISDLHRPLWLADGDPNPDEPEAKDFPTNQPKGFWEHADWEMEEYNRRLEDVKDDTYGATRELNMSVYRMKFPMESSMWFPRSTEEGIGYAGSKTCGEVMMSPLCLIRSLMDTEKWKNLFPCIIVNASMVPGGRELGYPEINDDTESARLEIQAELQVLSPLVGKRKIMFKRTCHRLEGGGWLVVDVPDSVRDCRQLPFLTSYLVHPYSRTGGISSVTWIGLYQYQRNQIHPFYHGYIKSGQGFGSSRWFRTLSRECRRRASHGHYYFSPLVSVSQQVTAPKRLVVLAKEMTTLFYSGIASATPCDSSIGNDADQSVLFDMGYGYWTATKSTRFHMNHKKLFELLLDLEFVKLGDKLMQISSDEMGDFISLHRHLESEDKIVVRETYLDNSEGVLVMAVLDSTALNIVSSVITSVFALSIHSLRPNLSPLCPDFSSLTVTYVQPSSSSQSQDDWKQQVSRKISDIIQQTMPTTTVD